MARRITKQLKNHTTRFQEGTREYIQLRQTVSKEGILNRSYGYYLVWSALIFASFAVSAYMMYITPLSWQLVVWSLLFGFFMVQIGGFMHDAGHRAIAKTPKINDILGHIYGGIVAVGYGAWNDSHNKHHSHTNVEDEDPDLDLPLHGFTQRQFAKQKGLWKVLRRYQAFIYYPLRTLTTFTRRMEPVSYFRRQKRWGMWWEVLIWLAGLFIYFALPFLIFDIAKATVIFLIVHFFTGFYMSNIFAPNHKGMPQLAKGIKLSFIEHQIMTSRNIDSHWLTDFVFLGLNYQIEHHLFPNCPRNKLKRVTPLVRDICRRMNLEYTSVSVVESNRIILSELSSVAKSH